MKPNQKSDQHVSKAGNDAAPQSFTNLLFTCEGTGKLVEHQVPSDAATLRDLWERELQLTCPHCGEVHRFAFRTAFVDGMLATTSLDAIARL